MANVVAQKLGTSVSIGRADVGIFNRLTLYEVVIRDQQDKDMLTARRLSATIDLLPLTKGKISIATGQLFGAHGIFYQRDSLSKPNFQFALDSLASKDTTSTAPLDLRINSLIMRHTSVSYDCWSVPKTPRQFNPKHLWCLRQVKTVETDAGVSYNQRVETQVERSGTGGILRSQ